MKSLFTAALLLSSTAIAQSTLGPFGLRMGMSLEDLRKVTVLQETKSPGTYASSIVPIPNTAFEDYYFAVSPTYGLCWVRASGITITTTADGKALQSGFVALKDALTSIYGKPTSEYDFVASDSLLKNSDQWMAALAKQDRFLTAYWITRDGAKLPSPYQNIGIKTSALSDTRGWVSLTYESPNYSSCNEEIKKANTTGL